VTDRSPCRGERVQRPFARGSLICWLIQPFNKKKLLKVSYPSGEIKLERATWKSGIEHPDCWLLPIKPNGEDLDISEIDIIKIDNAIELKNKILLINNS